MSLLEVAVSFGMEKFQWKRSKTVWVLGIVIILRGVPSALSLFTAVNVNNLDKNHEALPYTPQGTYGCIIST
jgi:SNF family Na+-dependent transporter